MSLEYAITYKAENHYENWVHTAYWRFLIIPQENSSQEFLSVDFTNSLNTPNEYAVNGYGFKTIRVHPRQKFKNISFEATFKLIKKQINPFDFVPEQNIADSYALLQDMNFKIDFEGSLFKTHFTSLPVQHEGLFLFDRSATIFDNLNALNHWTYSHLNFMTDVTDVNTTLDKLLKNRTGVCQDLRICFVPWQGSTAFRQDMFPDIYTREMVISGILRCMPGPKPMFPPWDGLDLILQMISWSVQII